jgi:hypothetical protein
VLAYFKAHLGLEPSEQGRVYTSFLVGGLVHVGI